jgi:hypothetical protein
MLEIVCLSSLTLWVNTALNSLSNCQNLSQRLTANNSPSLTQIELHNKLHKSGKYINPKEEIYLSDRDRDRETERLQERVFGSDRKDDDNEKERLEERVFGSDRQRDRNNRERNRDEEKEHLEERIFGNERGRNWERDRDRDRDRDRMREIERLRDRIFGNERDR